MNNSFRIIFNKIVVIKVNIIKVYSIKTDIITKNVTLSESVLTNTKEGVRAFGNIFDKAFKGLDIKQKDTYNSTVDLNNTIGTSIEKMENCYGIIFIMKNSIGF